MDKVKIVKNKRETIGSDNVPEIDIMGKPNISREVNKKIPRSTHLVSNPTSVSTPVVRTESADISPIDDELEDESLPYDDRFSQAVSMEEMLNVGKLFQQNDFGLEQENVVIDIMQKIQGTELYDLLENSIADASERIARLLDKNLKINESMNHDPQGNFDNFNIDDFI